LLVVSVGSLTEGSLSSVPETDGLSLVMEDVVSLTVSDGSPPVGCAPLSEQAVNEIIILFPN
jgi:hypothetical protein